MAIDLNFLAEAQAAEEMRRKDPVKRALWIAGILVFAMVVWSGLLQCRAMFAGREISRVEHVMGGLTNEYKLVLSRQSSLDEIHRKLAALDKLRECRFLQGSLLNALQQTTVEDVQLHRLKSEQTYSLTEEVKARTNDNRVIPGKPASVSEKVIVTLEASDFSPSPGDRVNTFKAALAKNGYFNTLLGHTNAVSLQKMSAPEVTLVPGSPIGKACVLFTLEARGPEFARQ